MADSYAVTTASAGQTTVNVPFPYLSTLHVHVEIDGVETAQGTLTWTSSSLITLPSALAGGETVKVSRSTPDAAPLFQAQPGPLDHRQLNRQSLQLLYVAQETADTAADAADLSQTNVDAIQTLADQAASSASAAATSAANVTSTIESAISEATSDASASATEAADSASAAAGSATAAASSASAAATSAADAAASAGAFDPAVDQMAAGTDTAFNDSDFVPAVKTADGTMIKRSWGNLKGAVWAAFGGLIAGGTSKGTPTDTDLIALSDQAASSATKLLSLGNMWANWLKAKVDAYLAPLASPALTGTPTAPTASAATNSTQIATTAYADAAAKVEQTYNAQASDYTLATGDAGGFVAINKASAATLTVPPNSSVAFPLNTRIDIGQYGAGQITVAAGAGVTIRSNSGKLKLTGQYSGGTLFKLGTNEWWLIGDIAA